MSFHPPAELGYQLILPYLLSSQGIRPTGSAWLLAFLGGLFLPGFAAAQARDPKIIEGAKKGQLVYYTTMTLDQSKVTVDQFEKSIRSSRSLCFAPAAGRY
jgi:hypothetical protein